MFSGVTTQHKGLVCEIQHDNALHYAERRCAECRGTVFNFEDISNVVPIWKMAFGQVLI